MDTGMTSDEGGRWLSYAELASARQIDRQSAIKLTRRHNWHRQKDNHGTVRAYVPAEWIGELSAAIDPNPNVPAPLFGAFESVISMLREQLAHERARAERAEVHRETERYRAEALRDRIEALHARLATAEAAAEAAEAEAAELRAAHLARQTLGLLARLRAAWRGD